MQKNVQRAFADFFGTFVLLDAHDGGIVAAYSKPKVPTSENAVFSEPYEPGSIVKVITLLAYLSSGTPDLFPVQCPGWMKAGDRIFYDSLKHGNVPSFEEALAQSCNLSFAKMGLTLGYPRLASMLRKFGFNGDDFHDLFLVFKTGKFAPAVNDDFELVNLSVGLNEISSTTFHAGLIAEVFARNGTFPEPFLIDSMRNVLNLGFYAHRMRIDRILPDAPTFAKIRKAMIEVVENENGTARRARLDSVRIAAKTGTAGDHQKGLDAIIIGFFPVESPAYAFALRLEGGGKAEFNGAHVLREFLRLLYPSET
jgi:peptidoglycan glycosyltransferase